MSNPNRHFERIRRAHIAPGGAWKCAGAGKASCGRTMTRTAHERGVLSML
jgi:hypothetical protein